MLKRYKKLVYNSSENVLEDLKKIVEKYKHEEFERVHFHFSGKYRKIIGSIGAGAQDATMCGDLGTLFKDIV